MTGGMVAEGGAAGGSSCSGDVREGELAGLTEEDGSGELAFLVPKKERVEDWGCGCSGNGSGSSEEGLVATGDLWGDGDLDLRLEKEVERKREGRLGGTGACMGRGRGKDR